ncbi:MAG: Ribonuclease P protein component [Acidimicrobiales bacterium]|nr:Ribonuclease P protein component [Acidimicrobiales bacterium]
MLGGCSGGCRPGPRAVDLRASLTAPVAVVAARWREALALVTSAVFVRAPVEAIPAGCTSTFHAVAPARVHARWSSCRDRALQSSLGAPRGGCVPEETRSEAHLSAEQPQAPQEARVPQAHVDPGRPGDHQGTSTQGSAAAGRLIWRVRDRSDFELLRLRGARARCGALGVRHVPAPPAGNRRAVAYAIRRRAAGAVERNRLKRCLRGLLVEVVREEPSLMPAGLYLVSAGTSAYDADTAALRGMLRGALGELRRRSGR